MSKYLDRNLSKKDRFNYEFNFQNEIFRPTESLIKNIHENGHEKGDE